MNSAFRKGLKILEFIILLFFVWRFFRVLFHTLIPGALEYPMGSFDFQWDSVKLLSMGLNPYKETLYHNIANGNAFEMYYGPVECNQFPSMLSLLLPYTVFGPLTAKTAWLISNGTFAVLLAVCLNQTVFKDSKPLEKLIFNLAWMTSAPLQITIVNGQHLLFSFSFFMLSVVLSERTEYTQNAEGEWKTAVIAGIVLGISYFKYTVTFVTVLYFIYRRWWKQIAVAGVMHAILTVAVSLWLRCSIIDMIRDSLMISEITGRGGEYDLMALLGNGILYKIIVILITGILFYVVFRAKKGNGKKEDYRILALLISFSMILVYHRLYDFFILIIPAYMIFCHLNLREKLHSMAIPEILYSVIILVVVWVVLFHNAVFNHLFPGLNWDTAVNISTFSSLYMMSAYFIFIEIKDIRKNITKKEVL